MAEFAPTTAAQLAEVVADAASAGTKLEIRGGGSKAAIGAPGRDTPILDMRGFSGVIGYDPSELVLSVGAGTQLAEVEALVAREGQMLAFEPFDYGPLLGEAAGASTIGGVVAAAIAGPRRLSRGSVRDHLLGFAAVSGRGEAFVAGGKVVKNVTGFDLPKLLAGSWGRLAALTEVTLKVLPAPRQSTTLVAHDLSPVRAYEVMARALGSQAEISAAAHLPGRVGGAAGKGSITAIRLEGFDHSIAARASTLAQALAGMVAVEAVEPVLAAAIWHDVRTLAPLETLNPLWRVSVPAKAWPTLIDQLAPGGAQWLADWGGGLIWLSHDGDPDLVRRAAAEVGGHAMFVRRGPALLASVSTFQPQPATLAALETRVRRAFDPAGVFECGRFEGATHAD